MNKNLITIYVVRHGESKGNVGITNGEKHKLGSELTEKGQTQARKLNNELENIHFDAIFSSDLRRTHQTAEIVALERESAVKTTNAIRERNVHHYHKVSGVKNFEDLLSLILKDLEELDDKAKMQYKHTLKMESAEEGALRLITFIKEASVPYSGKTIMVVCHGNIMRSLLTYLEYAKYDELPSGSIDNAGYFILESDGVDFKVTDTSGVNLQQNKRRNF